MEKSFIKYLDDYEVGLALNTIEKFFWNFCDDYIEIVKHRLYRPEEFGEISRYSGQKTIYIILYKLLQNFSIYFPFITEEIYQGIFKENISVHLTEIKSLEYNFEEEIKYGDMIAEIISHVRGEKTNNNVSLKTEVEQISILAESKLKDAIAASTKDFKATLFINELNLSPTESNFEIEYIELKK